MAGLLRSDVADLLRTSILDLPGGFDHLIKMRWRQLNKMTSSTKQFFYSILHIFYYSFTRQFFILFIQLIHSKSCLIILKWRHAFKMLFHINRPIRARLYDFSPTSSMCLLIASFVDFMIMILAVPALLLIKNLVRNKILHYVGILNIFIISKYLFVAKLLPKPPIKFSQVAIIMKILHLRLANIDLLVDLRPIHNIL